MSDQTVVVRLRAEVAAYQAAMRDAADTTTHMARESEQRLNHLGTTMTATGRMATRRLTLPIVGMGAASLMAGANFESGMNRVRGLTGATGADLEALESQARSLGATTQYSAGQAADAMGFLAMAGFEADEIVGAMPSTLQLAAAAQLDLAQAADITSNILTGYGLEVSELGHANDVLATAMTSANTNLVQLGDAMRYAGPVANSAGVEFEEAAAALALMGNAGIQGSMAGTSLRGAISRLLNPTGEAADVMRRLGIEATDADGNLVSLEAIVSQLETSGASTADMMLLFGQRAGPAMSALVSQGSDALRDLTANLRDSEGAAETLADIQMEGLTGAMRRLRSAAESLAISFADSGLLDGATSLALTFADMLQWASELNPWILQVAGGLGALVAAVGPLMWMGGIVVRNLRAIATGIRLVATAAVATPGRIMGVVRALGPMGLSGVGFGAALAVGAVAYQINRSRQRAQEARQRIQDYARAIEDAGDAAEGTANQIDRMLDEHPHVVRMWAELGVEVDELSRKVHASDDEWTAYRARLVAVAEEAGYTDGQIQLLIAGLEGVRNEAREAVELNDLRDSLDGVGDAAVRAREKVGPAADAMGTAARLAYEAAGGTGDLADGFDDVADGADNARHALAELNDAMRAMNDPIFAYDRAQRSLAEAQADLNEAIAEHGPNSQEAADATWDLYQAATDLSYAERELIRAFEEGEISAALFNAQLEEMVAQGRLTAEQAEEARRRVQGLTEAAKEADKQSIRIHVSAAVDAALASIQAVGSALAALPAVTSVMVQSTAVGKTLNRAPTRATGGPTSAYETYLVGEEGPELLTMGSTGGHIYPAQSPLTMAGTAPAAPTTAGFAGGMSGGLAGHGGGEVHHHYELHGEFNGFGPGDIPKIADEVSRYLAWQSRARARGER